MIYVDTSVALAQLLAEDRKPDRAFWKQALISSRLLEYELLCVINGRGLTVSHGDAARQLVARIALLEMIPEILGRAREPFPAPLRTLDALHLAAVEFLRAHAPDVRLASYDDRLLRAARKLKIPLAELT